PWASRPLLQSKLVKYFSRQLSCKRKVALQERNAKLEGFPQLLHWFRIVNIRKEVMEEIAPGQLSLEELLEMTDDQVCKTVEKFGANSEECARLNASLSCLRSVHKSGGSLSKQDWTIQWPTPETGKENNPACQPEPVPWLRTHLAPSPKVPAKCGQHYCHAGSAHGPIYTHVDRLTVEGHPGLCPPVESGHRSLPPSPRQRHALHTPPRTPNIVTTMTPPGTPPVRRRNKLKPPGTPPPSSRKLIHLLPGFTALHRSKSHEFQLGHRVDEAHTPNFDFSNSGRVEQRQLATAEARLFWRGLPRSRSEPHRAWRAGLQRFSIFAAGRSRRLGEAAGSLAAGMVFARGVAAFPGQVCPQSATSICFLSWRLNRSLNQSVVLCRPWGTASPSQASEFGAEPVPVGSSAVGKRLPSEPLRGQQSCSGQEQGRYLSSSSLAGPRSLPGPKMQLGAALVPCSTWGLSASGTSAALAAVHMAFRLLALMMKLSKIQNPAVYWYVVHSSNPNTLRSSSPRLATPTASGLPHAGRRRFWVVLHLPRFGSSAPSVSLQNEEGNEEAQESEDDFEEMNLSLLSARNFPRKASQTSIFLQEWDIPFEQLEIGELIGKGRFGQVFHGRWHGEVAIRLIDIERDNEDQLKAFKREVMAYRQTRHENVVLFMGACMSPPHLAIITSLCKGRTLYSVVRDAKIVLDVNKTRQIAQEIVKGMGYLHAKGILHKDLKSKNVFYDNGKVVITDFGLFSISGVLQAGRRENKLRIQNGWLCHLAPEIIRQLSPDTEEDKLPFSKHSDVFALGTIWYELHAREWPFKTQPAEAIIWQVGRGMKPNLSQIGMGKEISDILLFCWAYEQEERPTFTKLMDMLEKLPKRNRRLSHPGHFWKSAE
ncbi:KSR2 Kinase, partial [Dromaius novaehollandiae]|nr:KSR2 Kinase [Dromaius novaehollandiae]